MKIATLQLLVITVLLSSCSSPSTYNTAKVAQSAAKAQNKITAAKGNLDSGQSRVKSAATKVKAAQTYSNNIELMATKALAAIRTKQFEEASLLITNIQLENKGLTVELRNAQDDLAVTTQALDQAKVELIAASGEIDVLKLQLENLQREIDKSASDRAIVKRVNSWFGLGAIFYGVERLLKAGIVGIIIFIIIIVALMAMGVPALGVLTSIWSKIKSRDTS